uniref:Uncharacterized protein n=1 Tax=Wuchereria bancrofti TaxID=6293 RepID=A0A1I8EYQ5_WUCBA
ILSQHLLSKIDRQLLFPSLISFNEKTEEKPENKSEEPIASRTRMKMRLQNLKGKSSSSMKALLLITLISLMYNQTVAMNNCKEIPLHIPEQWNWEEVMTQNITLHKVDVYTHVLIWMTNNEIQYSYGWLRVKCQVTTNFLSDGKRLVSNLDPMNNCMTQKEICITPISIVLWNNSDIINRCLYRKIGRFDAIKYENHLIIDELQSSFIIDGENKTFAATNCGLTNPYRMKGDIILDIDTKNSENWLSISNPTLAARLLLQRNDVMTKKVSGKLLIAPCKTTGITIQNIEFKANLINNTASTKGRTEPLWQEIYGQGEEIVAQLENDFDEVAKSIQEEIESVKTHWRLIVICVSIIVIAIVLIILKWKFELKAPITAILNSRQVLRVCRKKDYDAVLEGDKPCQAVKTYWYFIRYTIYHSAFHQHFILN